MQFACLVVRSSDFGIATTLDIFQKIGKYPDLMERLKILVRDGAMWCAVYFNIAADIPSGPVDLAVSSDSSSFSTSSTEQNNSSGDSRHGGSKSRSRNDSGNVELLKHSWKKLFNISAFSWLVVASMPLCFNVGREDGFFDIDFTVFQNFFD